MPRKVVFSGTLHKVHENRLKVTNCNDYHKTACRLCQNGACMEKIESTHGNSLNVMRDMRKAIQSNISIQQKAEIIAEKSAMLTDMVAWREGEVGMAHNWNELYADALRNVVAQAAPGERMALWRMILKLHKNEGKVKLN